MCMQLLSREGSQCRACGGGFEKSIGKKSVRACVCVCLWVGGGGGHGAVIHIYRIES